MGEYLVSRLQVQASGAFDARLLSDEPNPFDADLWVFEMMALILLQRDRGGGVGFVVHELAE